MRNAANPLHAAMFHAVAQIPTLPGLRPRHCANEKGRSGRRGRSGRNLRLAPSIVRTAARPRPHPQMLTRAPSRTSPYHLRAGPTRMSTSPALAYRHALALGRDWAGCAIPIMKNFDGSTLLSATRDRMRANRTRERNAPSMSFCWRGEAGARSSPDGAASPRRRRRNSPLLSRQIPRIDPQNPRGDASARRGSTEPADRHRRCYAAGGFE